MASESKAPAGCRPWFNFPVTTFARPRRRSPDTYALHACKLCAPRTMLSLAGRSIRSADGRPDRRSATKTRFHTDFTGGFYHFSTSRSPTPFPAPSPSTCRRRRRNKHLRLHCFNGLIRFFLFAGRCGSTENGRCEAKSTRCSASSRQEGRQEI